ncbi:uncharacterized protein [Rutidosis leptorrhynchoides]|uniref:uncharacterized protein n=1 Tax=Rutidosis leptorrhynchoides TaxID=125765 RepID=UPI003A99123B
MRQYLSLVQNLADQFETFQVSHVMRGKNKKADALSKLAALAFNHPGKRVFIEELHAKSIVVMPLVAPVKESGSTWITPIIAFLRDGTLPADSTDAKKIRTKAPMYALEGNVLYRKNYLGPLLWCVGPNEAEEVIREVHEGACPLHSRHMSIVSKIKRLVSSAWPFCKWAIDIVGPFPKVRVSYVDSAYAGNIKFLIVAIDYFTNDNDTPFTGDPFRSWSEEINIKQTFTSVAHPQANGQCEVTNRDIVAGIKARLGHCHVGWVDELPNVLWAHGTKPKLSTGETPFSLVYGSEAVVPVEIGVQTFRVQNFDEESNSEALRENLNLLEERRLSTAVNEANNKQKIAKYYNQHVRSRSYKSGDLLWR